MDRRRNIDGEWFGPDARYSLLESTALVLGQAYEQEGVAGTIKPGNGYR
jgi:hypothetical protein